MAKNNGAERRAKYCRTNQSKPSSTNPFESADDIYLTKNKIAVTRTISTSAKRGYTKTTQTKYYAKNRKNIGLLKKARGNTVREGRKSINYREI